eukprot:Gb_41169 [translate_table: standard]
MKRTEKMEVKVIRLEEMKALKVLGRGAVGTVFLVAGRDDRLLAVKVMSKSAMQSKEDGLRRTLTELEIMSSLQHPFLSSLLGSLETEKIVALIGEYCPGGDLNALRQMQGEKTFSESVIRFYVAEIVIALEHLHSQGIVYRDLKPENILIQASGHIMLTDFDLSTRLPPMQFTRDPETQNPKQNKHSKRIPHLTSMLSCLNPLHSQPTKNLQNPTRLNSEKPNSAQVSPVNKTRRSTTNTPAKTNSFVGTEEYVAPEMLKGTGHEFAVDWWALGILVYEMLYGKTPFRGSTRKETFYNILVKQPQFMGPWTPLRDLIIRLLEKEPSKRLCSLKHIKTHLFFKGLNWDTIQCISRPPFVPSSLPLEDMKNTINSLDMEEYVDNNSGNSSKQNWVRKLSKWEDTHAFGMF